MKFFFSILLPFTDTYSSQTSSILLILIYEPHVSGFERRCIYDNGSFLNGINRRQSFVISECLTQLKAVPKRYIGYL